MRTRPTVLTLTLCLAASLAAVPAGYAGDKKAAAQVFRLEGELTTKDPRDKVLKTSYRKSYTFKMTAGQTYRIDLMSKDFDAFLRLEDPTGAEVAADDDSGGGENARIIYRAKKDGTHRIIATSLPPDKTGKYTLLVAPATPEEAFLARARAIADAEPDERKTILAELTKRFTARKEKLRAEDAQLALEVASSLELAAPALAAEAYTEFGKALAGAGDKAVADFGGMFAGAARRVALPGKELELKGTTLDGKEIDLKSYRGKVVLVDFWATWCGPCVREIPNVRKMYEQYRAKGFEVLGVSVDAERETLVKFLDRAKLPWQSLNDRATEAGMGPLARRYGIFSIPQAILVDRAGRVLSLNARGPELGRLLEQHLGEKKK